MSIFLDRIDTAPIANDEFSAQMMQWFAVLIDTLNEDYTSIELALNFLTAPNFTDTEITQLEADGALVDGVLLYDTVNNVYVGRENGSLVKFTTTAWP